MVWITEIMWRLTQSFRVLLDGKTENEIGLEFQTNTLKERLVESEETVLQLEELSGSLQEQIQGMSIELNSGDFRAEIYDGGTGIFRSKNLEFSPSNWIDDRGVAVSSTQAYIRQPHLKKLRVANTNSMLPTVDGDHAVLVLPREHWGDQLPRVGDIIVWKKEGNINSVAHRIVKIGRDSQGYKYITMGDNLKSNDGWIRWDEIQSVVVAVVY